MQKPKRKFLVLLTALCAASWQPVCAQATDTLSLSDKVHRTAALASRYRGGVWQNSALYHYYSPFSHTTVKMNGNYADKGVATLKQEGDKEIRYGMDVCSFIVLSADSRVFGSAGYHNERKENVLWNENTDWHLVAPYVTGDSIGGFMQGETYYFNGGYTHEIGKLTWAITGGYRAAHNYRDKDPRPRNTVSDLSFSIGAGYKLPAHRIAVEADIRLYQQNSEVSFLADKGSTSVYHMLGLGMDYVRFAGKQTGVKYQGTQWGANIGLLPIDTENGISAALSVAQMSMNKNLSSANNLNLLKLMTTELKGNITWMRTLANAQHIALKTDVTHFVRQGIEHIYGEAGGNSYGSLIGTTPGVKMTNTEIALGALWERLATRSTTWGGAIAPEVGYRRTTTDYASTSRFLYLSGAEGMIRARLYYQKKEFQLTTELLGGYHANLSTEQSLPGMNAQKSQEQTLLANIHYLTDSYVTAGIRLQGDYPISSQYNLYLSAQWQAAFYKNCGTAPYAALSLGVFF